MFTGIIQDIGRVERVWRTTQGARIALRTKLGTSLRLGDSLSVDGACLTAEALDGELVTVSVVRETLARTTLGQLEQGDAVHLEPALAAGDPLGGHLVQGHVDACCRVTENRDVAGDLGFSGWGLTVELPADLGAYVVEKGSIAIDGVSLTVASLRGLRVSMALVPHTLERTLLRRRKAGDKVNVEVDILAKYVGRMLAWGHTSREVPGGTGDQAGVRGDDPLTEDTLRKLGY